jgi:hypothetical protein
MSPLLEDVLTFLRNGRLFTAINTSKTGESARRAGFLSSDSTRRKRT